MVAIVFLLRAASELLIPIVLAVLISYALEPVVGWMAQHHIPHMTGAGARTCHSLPVARADLQHEGSDLLDLERVCPLEGYGTPSTSSGRTALLKLTRVTGPSSRSMRTA